MAKDPFKFTPPGDEQSDLLGSDLNIGSTANSTIYPNRMIHRVSSAGGGSIATIIPPYRRFIGPLYLIAIDHSLAITSNGNISVDTVLTTNYVVALVYFDGVGLWYPISKIT